MGVPGRRAPAIEAALASALLLMALVMPQVAGRPAPYLTLLVALVGAIYLAVRRSAVPLLVDTAGRLFWVAVGILAAVFAITAQSPHDLIYVFNFTALMLFVPMYTLLRRFAAPSATLVVALLALIGVAMVFANALLDSLVAGMDRVSAPNRAATNATLLGFTALLGLLAPVGRWRAIFLAGPAMAVATELLAGSRGVILVLPPLMGLAIRFLVPRHRLVVAGLAVVALVACVVAAGLFTELRSVSSIRILEEIFTSGQTTDPNASVRLLLWRAGAQAFLEAPLVGHGWARLMPAAVAHIPAAAAGSVATLPQLHNDIINFAVTGGVVGVGVYFLIVATPLFAAWRSARDGQYRTRLFGTAMLACIFLVQGLTDLTVGFEYGTAQFAVFSAILLGYCRDGPSEATPPVSA